MGDRRMDGWMDVYLSSNFLQIDTPTVFIRFLRNLAHVIYVPIRKKCGTDFRKFALKKFWQILRKQPSTLS